MVRKVKDWRDARSSTARAVDIGVTVLRALLEFGRQRATININAADRIGKLYQEGSRAEIIWMDDDIHRFTAKATELNQLNIVDGLRLAALTGLRRADLVTLTWANVGKFALVKKALKSSRPKRRFATMPRITELDALLDELAGRTRQEGVETLLVNSYGRRGLQTALAAASTAFVMPQESCLPILRLARPRRSTFTIFVGPSQLS